MRAWQHGAASGRAEHLRFRHGQRFDIAITRRANQRWQATPNHIASRQNTGTVCRARTNLWKLALPFHCSETLRPEIWLIEYKKLYERRNENTVRSRLPLI